MARRQEEQLLRDGLSRTRQSFFGRIAGLLSGQQISEEFWEELEALLIQADVGVETTLSLMETLRQVARRNGLRTSDQVRAALRQELVEILRVDAPTPEPGEHLLYVILVVGVNGSGKTTTIAKLAHHYRARGKRVLLAAADTFRAAAIDQLRVWGERAGAEVIAHQPGADPGAVVYDAIRASRSRGAQILIVDTAGRLHTKYNLMQELKKIHGVAAKQVHRAPHETLLVLDATTGQNALAQATHFKEAVNLTGVALAKLDGTAKGGMVFAVVRQLGVPVRYVGLGEGLEDFAEFDPELFVSGLLEG
ncbi:MAG: signal recognition particle-docking protein FtsY [Anaerolineae bacterium]